MSGRHPDLVVARRTTLARDPFEVEQRDPVVTGVADAVAAELERPAEISGVSYWADSAFIAAAGIPTVLFGPDGEGAHAEVEWVSMSGTRACARVLTSVATRFCR